MFRAPAQQALPAHPVSNLVFSADGRRVLVRLEDGSLAAAFAPTSGRATPSRPTLFRPDPDHRVIGAGWSRRRGGILAEPGFGRRDAAAKPNDTRIST